MSANLPPSPLVIRDWLKRATAELKNIGIPSPRLDAEVILAHTVRKSRTYLHAHLDEHLTHHQHEIADARLELRRDRTPVAYIIGHKEFYGRRFRVSPATLIPRPESEEIITMLKEIAAQQTVPLLQTPAPHLVDVGTGSGCLGITAKLELPELAVTLLDTSRHALNVAESNAASLDAHVAIVRSDLLTNYPLSANYILANLPYVDSGWERSPETDHEPPEALFAEDGGLALIYKLLAQASVKLAGSGFIFIEADPRQHRRIVDVAKSHGLMLREIRSFIVCFQKS
jgi:release factor glutamine methyltransferase